MSEKPHVQIWRTTFGASAGDALPTGWLPPEAAGPDTLIDIVKGPMTDGHNGYAVLLSSSRGGKMTSFLAFTNVPLWGDRLRQRGFACVEAEIASSTADATLALVVRIPFFPRVDPLRGALASSTELATDAPFQFTDFLTLGGIDFSERFESPPSWGENELADFQPHTVPEAATPRSVMSTIVSDVILKQRGDEHFEETPLAAAVALLITPTRYPELASISQGRDVPGSLVSKAVLEYWPDVRPFKSEQGVVTGRPRSSPFGAPPFGFTGLETIGFRLDLKELGAAAEEIFEQLIQPLNFHLRDPQRLGLQVTPFRFCAASTTLVIELIRYRKMMQADSPGLTEEDFTSQHELAVRVVVGRVDDDTAQARCPAIFVPSIFVDNPWSKVVGRELLGYDKHLAHFCTGDRREDILSMGGNLRHVPRRPDISEISVLRIVSRVTDHTSERDVLLRIDCPAQADLRFTRVDGFGAAAAAPLAGPWTQTDFGRPEFRRAFARTMLGNGFTNFDFIQAAPVDERELPPSWITGTYALSDVEVAFPTGIATLTFPSLDALAGFDDVPESWRLLCRHLQEEPVALPTGSWYRLNCSMNLTVNSLLDG